MIVLLVHIFFKLYIAIISVVYSIYQHSIVEYFKDDTINKSESIESFSKNEKVTTTL